MSWNSYKTYIPKENKDYIVYAANNETRTYFIWVCYYLDGYWHFYDAKGDFTVLYWIHIPEPPVIEDDNG